MRVILAVCLVLVGCGRSSRAAGEPPSHDAVGARIDAAADAFVAAYLEIYAEDAELWGMAEAPHDRFSDRSPGALARWQAKVDELDAATRSIDASALFGRPAWTTLGFLREGIAQDQALRVCRSELWSVDSEDGLHLRLMRLAQLQPVGTPAARAAALRRWRSMPSVIDTEIANLREGVRLGYLAARDVVRRVVGQLDTILAGPVSESGLRDPSRRDAALAVELDPLVEGELLPALRRYRDFLVDEYLPRAREALGVGANPDGAACWRAQFRRHASLDRAPEETIALGHARVEQFNVEARAIARDELGLDPGSDLAAQLEVQPDNQVTESEVLAFSHEVVARAERAMSRTVTHVPVAQVVVQPYPGDVDGARSASYQPPEEGGDRPGVYWLDASQPTTRGETEMIAFHETWPGHHLQIATAREVPERHRISELVGVGAYVEGWGRYAEQLAEELGLYTSAYARIRRRLWPGRGMVVDPGIHLGGWTRAQAIDYIVAGGMSREFADGLVDRIAGWPAQLTSYDTGGIELLALRDEARARLGEQFDLRRFHDCVLSAGAVTLPMLRQHVEACLP